MKDMNITINDTKQASTVKRAVADSVATEKEAIRQEKESEKLKTNIEINNQESLEVRKGSEKKLVAKKAVNNVVETVVKEEVIKKTSEKVVL